MNETHKSTADENFDKLITVMISSVAVLVAITAFLQNYASNIADKANRRAQNMAIQSTTKQLKGAIQFSYDWEGAFQTWRELHLQMIAAEQAGDDIAAERYQQMKERVAGLSPLLGQYFNQTNQWPDTYKYESDLYLVEATRLSEMYEQESAIGREWSDTADRFVIQITLLTVALSLYGLSITLKGRVRWLFVIVGSGIVGFCALWLATELILPKPLVNEEAINLYANGVGQAYVGDNEQAISSLNQAINLKPEYANAYNERAGVYYNMGDYDHAVQDYEAAREAGRNDVNVYWNLGWTYYLLGRYEEAIAANDIVLSEDPTILGMRMNQALTYLAMGDLENARHQYDLLIAEAERQVVEAHDAGFEPPASLWYYMDAGAVDLQNLIDQLDGNPKSWTFAPPADLVRGDHLQVQQAAFDQMVRLKETIVSLEYTDRLPQITDVMQVSEFTFGHETYDDQGQVSEFEEFTGGIFPYDTESVTVYFEYSGPVPQQPLVWKIYQNGSENQSLRDVWSAIDISESTAWYKFIGYSYTSVFVFNPGEYVVELYADSRLVQRGTFYIENP
jgi:tetratricopeptide (TPR) repeat protein